MTPLIQKLIRIYPDIGLDYTWFDIEEAWANTREMFDHDRSLAALQSPLPFDKCVIAGVDENNDAFFVMVKNAVWAKSNQKGIVVTAQVLQKKKPFFGICPPFFCMPQVDLQENSDEGMNIYFLDKKEEEDPRNMEAAITSLVAVSFWLERLNDSRTTGYRATPRGNHAKRLRQGKKPLFDWHTVVVQPKKEKNESLGGTHVSPRQHDVRGHWVVRNGNKFWRRAHKRGDASKGVIFHDYVVKPVVERREAC